MSQESLKKNRTIGQSHKNLLLKSKKSICLKWTYGHSCNDYSVATLSKSYLTTTEITKQSLKSIGQFKHVFINNKSYPSVTDGRTDRP